MTIVTDNLISYDYFKEHFSNTIEYFKKASLTFDYGEDVTTASNVYNHYQQFSQDIFKKDIVGLTQNWGSITIPLMIFLMADYGLQLKNNIDILKPLRFYADSEHEQYLEVYKENLQRTYETYFTFMGVEINEFFVFEDKKLPQYLKEISNNPSGFNYMDDILTIIRHNKEFPDDPASSDSTLSLDFNKIQYTKTIPYSDIWAYLLFNLILLDKRYVVYFTSEHLDTQYWFVTECMLLDIDKLTEFLEFGISGTIISIGIRAETLAYITDQEWLNTLKKTIQDAYNALKWNNNLSVGLLALTKHIEKQIKAFPKAEFFIGTKNWTIDFVTDHITVSDPKRYHEVEKKVGDPDKSIKTKKSVTYQKKRKIEEL